MKKINLLLHILFLLLVLIHSVSAGQEPFVDEFIGSPLLILVAVIIIDVIAFIFHKVRR